MATTDAQKLQKGYAEISHGVGPLAKTIKVWGTIGTLEFIGLTPSVSGLLEASGEDKVVTRKVHKRSRWLGDRVGSSVNETTSAYSLYPSRRGSSLPGTPIKIVNMDEELPSGGSVSYTIQVDGPIGTFISYWVSKPHAFVSKIIGKTGNSYTGVVNKTPVTPPAF